MSFLLQPFYQEGALLSFLMSSSSAPTSPLSTVISLLILMISSSVLLEDFAFSWSNCSTFFFISAISSDIFLSLSEEMAVSDPDSALMLLTFTVSSLSLL